MYLIEVSDQEQTINMNVLCKDSLNFSFVVAVLSSVDRENKELLQKMFESVTPLNNSTVITADQIFQTYARNVIDQEARKIVSNYETSEIVAKRKEILGEIQTSVSGALDGTIIDVKRVTVNNLDFPEVVTRAQEERARRQVEIETERAEQKKRLLKAENALKISELQYKQQLLEAAMIADSNRIIGASLSPEYLAWWQLKTMSEAAQGPNNWGFIPYSDFTQGQVGKLGSNTSGAILDAALRQKIEEARKEIQNLDERDEAPPKSENTVVE